MTKVKGWAVVMSTKDISFYSQGDQTEMPFAIFSEYDKHEAEQWAKRVKENAKVSACTIHYD